MHSEGSYNAEEHQTRQDDDEYIIVYMRPVDGGDEVTYNDTLITIAFLIIKSLLSEVACSKIEI